MKKTGELLKQAREAKGLSLHEIGLSLKINSKILKAIEDGDKEQLPAKTFLRGFVQSYANYLKLNVEEVLKNFSEEMGSTKPETIIKDTSTTAASSDSSLTSEAPSAQKAKESSSLINLEQTDNTKALMFALTAVILAGFIIITMKTIEKYQREAQPTTVEITEPIQGSTSSAADMTAAPATGSNDRKSAEISEGLNSSVEKKDTKTTSVSTATSAAEPAKETNTTSAVTTTTANTSTHSTKKPEETKPAPTTPPSPTIAAAPATTPKPAEANPAKPATPVAKEAPKTTEPPKVVAAATPAPTPAKPTPPKDNTPAKVAAAPEPKSEKKPELTSPAPAEKPPTPATTVAKTEAKPAATPTPAKTMELIIEALDAVEMEFSGTSGKLEKMKLNPGQVHTIKSKAGLKLSVNNGGAINLILNGKDLGVPGDLGKPIKLNY